MSSSATNSSTNCSNCNAALAEGARFCSQCGQSCQSHKKSKLNLKQFSIILGLTLAIGAATYSLQGWFQGNRPKQSAVQKTKMQQASTAPAADTSLNSEEIFSKAEAAMQKIAESQNPEPSLMLEAVDLLSRILSAEPDNAWALLQMAELAFEQRIFDKSSEFYSRYLKIEAEDNAVRTRYASALTFMGKTDLALSELQVVLDKEPSNFQALAFSAIANQQSGQKAKAQELLAKAIVAAPSEEAKNRLLKFAESLNKQDDSATTQPVNTTQPTPAGLSPARGNINSDGSFSGLDSFFKNHPIAGPKYAGLEVKGNEIRVSFNSFPMDKMPPMVKDKFSTNSAIEAKKETNGKAFVLVFVDSASGAEMHRVEVK